MNTYPKRLIEVDLPIKRISAHARVEKGIRNAHIATLHLWWARRPLSACRAVICAALWPDPADQHCPALFRDAVVQELTRFAEQVVQDRSLAEQCDSETFKCWQRIARHDVRLNGTGFSERMNLRALLLGFISDYAYWQNSTRPEYLATCQYLTEKAHEALGGPPGTRPLAVDPFAGGGSIPLEALRAGADAFAGDLNPVAVLLNKVVLEYGPKYGRQLADEVLKWGEWIKVRAEQELAKYYPKDPDGATPIAYLWSRSVTCEGPGCGGSIPLMRSLWLSKSGGRSAALEMIPDAGTKQVTFRIVENPRSRSVRDGTVRRGSATCPICGFTTPVESVRRQLSSRRGGAADARLLAVVTTRPNQQGRFYRLPTAADLQAVSSAASVSVQPEDHVSGALSAIPDEPLPPVGTLGFRVQRYGVVTWGDLFTPRQALALATICGLIRKAGEQIAPHDGGLGTAVQAVLALALSRSADHMNSCCSWNPSGQKLQHLFTRQALPIVWDFCEANPFGNSVGDWSSAIDCGQVALRNSLFARGSGTVVQASATSLGLPDDAAQMFITDPPYYDAVPYADLSDFFYVWLKRSLPLTLSPSFMGSLTPKDEECIADPVKGKDRAYFERSMQAALAEGRRVLAPNGIGVVVFAHKSTAGWEAQLQAMVDAGWTVTGSWPLDTEMGTRLRARDSAALASSVHLVCRPRENPDGSLQSDAIGDWRDVLAELPQRIHEWMPRLAREGVVGADAIFACLGPALEVFSRYSRVEKASGEQVTLREYLEHVWAAVAREALAMVFSGADATGFEADARLTAIWLWTLSTGDRAEPEADDEAEPDEEGVKNAKSGGFVLEFDDAMHIAQGLGAHLDQLPAVVEVRGDKSRLLAVRERTRYLFGKDAGPAGDGVKKRDTQLNLFGGKAEQEEAGVSGLGLEERVYFTTGGTVLDRVHQAMLLFGSGRGEAMRRFLVEEGAGNDQRFWRLAQALSALYPPHSDEKRWVDGVLARKKGLGF